MRRPRAYDSPLRRQKAARTRAAVIESARQLFAERGWSGASMRDIARGAGVSVETVYASVGSKTEVLKLLLDVAVVGDDRPVPLAERAEFLALGDGARHQRVAAAVSLCHELNKRVVGPWLTLRSAAGAEPELRELRDQIVARRQLTVRHALTGVLGQPPPDHLLASVHALTGDETYASFISQPGEDDDSYARWLTGLLGRELAPYFDSAVPTETHREGDPTRQPQTTPTAPRTSATLERNPAAAPLLQRSFTYADHKQVGRSFIDGVPKPELAKRGMWITDNASDEEKAKQAMWGGTPAFALAPITVEETLA